jgi:hypothetical protein
MSKFSVIILGAIDDSAEGRKRLKKRLNEEFQISTSAIEDIFDCLPATLKEGLSFQEAQIFSSTLESVGAKIKTEIINDSSAESLQFEFDSSEDQTVEQENLAPESTAEEIQTEPEIPSETTTLTADSLSNSQINRAFDKIPTPTTVVEPIPQQAADNYSKRKLAGFFITLVVIAVGLTVYLSLSYSKPTPTSSLTATNPSSEKLISDLLEKQQLIKADESSKTSKTTDLTASTFEQSWQGQAVDEKLAATASILFLGNKLKSLSLNLTGTEPEKRTPEEIVAKVPAKVWLNKAEFVFDPSAEERPEGFTDNNTTLEIKGKGRAFLRQEATATRVIPEFLVTLKKAVGDSSILLEWTAGPENIGQLKPGTIEKREDNTFKLLLTGSVTLSVTQN